MELRSIPIPANSFLPLLPFPRRSEFKEQRANEDGITPHFLSLSLVLSFFSIAIRLPYSNHGDLEEGLVWPGKHKKSGVNSMVFVSLSQALSYAPVLLGLLSLLHANFAVVEAVAAPDSDVEFRLTAENVEVVLDEIRPYLNC
ncbi:hypothetical protein RHSIM_Rhsim11G0174900 [Rhododendron simsii]|uniref:Uncharacterized protein n=1 Tax=Rhododendron simsii TaxID=118357 RepID=A0A834LAN0_RHOSS|nr:hypothetical protein RHSIM_Rhsim11G0174900 [Rhododendron simsii]